MPSHVSPPAFVTHFVRAARFLAVVDEREVRHEGYYDLLWSLELLLKDILTDANERLGEGWTLTKLREKVRSKAGLPLPLDRCLGEVIEHRNIFAHALMWEHLDGNTYYNDLVCVRLLALWYLRDFSKGPRLDVNKAAQLLAGGRNEEPSSVRSSSIFLSYAKEDETQARDLYDKLIQRGHKPWMDKEDLLPGQEWEYEIRRAIQGADFFIALMSSHSVTKKGFVQKEIRYALDVLGEMPTGRIYFIPIRLDTCEVPDPVKRLHWLDLQQEDGFIKLCRAIEEA